jgi:hypothetical protein
MRLFAILRVDVEYLHPGSCIVVEADSLTAIAQDMLAHPDKWKPLLYHLYPDYDDLRSIWQRIKEDALTPEELLSLIHETRAHEEFDLMVRILPIYVQSMQQLQFGDLWKPFSDDQFEHLD